MYHNKNLWSVKNILKYNINKNILKCNINKVILKYNINPWPFIVEFTL